MLDQLVKDFKKWLTLKVEIHAHHTSPLFHRGEIWWCAVGMNVGSEINGKNNLFERPVYIFRKCGTEMFLGIPLTTKEVQDKPYYCRFHFQQISRVAVLSQVRMLSAQRLIRRVGKVGEKQKEHIHSSFIEYMAYNENGPLAGSSGA